MNLGRAASFVHVWHRNLSHVVIPSFLAIAGSAALCGHVRADVPSWYNECGVESSSSSGSGSVGCAADSAEFVVKFLFVSFPNVLDVLGVAEQPLPTWADSVVTDLMDYIEFMSVGRVTLDATIEKRSDADSLFYWVTDQDSDDVCPNKWDVINLLPPEGWNEGVDLVVYVQTDQICGQSAPPSSYGAICGTPPAAFRNNWIRHFSGFLQANPPDWLSLTRNKFETILIHEVGHSFHTQDFTGHMPSGANGEVWDCPGPYFGCFGSAMNMRLDMACLEDDGVTTKNNGLIPYHPFSMMRQGFLRPDTIGTTTYDVELGDVRLYPNEGVFIPLSQWGDQGFVLTNHQLTGFDQVLGERGMAIWHYASRPPYEECPYQESWILDLEHPGGKWTAIDPGEYGSPDAYCRDNPVAANADAGVDSLDCAESGTVGALWSGTAWSPGSYRSIDRTTNPSSNRYPDVIEHRLTAQVDTTGVAIRNIQAIADSLHPGKYKMRFDVIIDYPW